VDHESSKGAVEEELPQFDQGHGSPNTQPALSDQDIIGCVAKPLQSELAHRRKAKQWDNPRELESIASRKPVHSMSKTCPQMFNIPVLCTWLSGLARTGRDATLSRQRASSDSDSAQEADALAGIKKPNELAGAMTDHREDCLL
jgi:hypothetical protein